MRWSNQSGSSLVGKITFRIALSLVIFSTSILVLSGVSEEKRLTVYSGTLGFSATVQEKSGIDYVDLLQVLQPLGTTTAGITGRVWKLSFNRQDGEFTPNQTKVRVSKQE